MYIDEFFLECEDFDVVAMYDKVGDEIDLIRDNLSSKPLVFGDTDQLKLLKRGAKLLEVSDKLCEFLP